MMKVEPLVELGRRECPHLPGSSPEQPLAGGGMVNVDALLLLRTQPSD